MCGHLNLLAQAYTGHLLLSELVLPGVVLDALHKVAHLEPHEQ